MMVLSPSTTKTFSYSLCLAMALSVTSLTAQETQPPAPQLPEVLPAGPPLPPPEIPALGAEAATTPALAEDIETDVLTRGPVHEAFAEQYTSDPTPTLAVKKQPPELINELPPEDVPSGENVQWIPGYWAWDEDIDDFIWISGLWRDIPPGQRWVPGYWAEENQVWQWVPGFWTSAETDELAYLPEPPESLEQGPNVVSPGTDYFWVPGCWIYQTNNYVWRTGYWSRPYNDYMWVPARYQWTPRGYVYCSGYWDYPLFRRGVLFSPVRFANRRFPRRYYGYRYQPRLAVSVGPLLIHLFVRPRYRHYYFGDYYAHHYVDRGIYPFTRLNRYGRRGYFHDPIRSHYQVASRRTTFNRLTDWQNYFERHESYRPPRTFEATRRFVASDANRTRNQLVIQQATLSEPFTELSREGRRDRQTFTRISSDLRNDISNRSFSTVRDLTEQRLAFENRRNRGDNEAGEGRNGFRGPRIGRDDDDGSRRGPQINTKVDRDERITALKLPEAEVLRDRIGSFRDQRRNDNDDDRRGAGNDSDGRLRTLRGADDRGLTNRNERAGDNGSASSLESLRERIEAARNERRRGSDDENDNRIGRTENSARERSDNDPQSRIQSARERIEAARNARQNASNDASTQSGKQPEAESTRTMSVRERLEAARRAAEQGRNRSNRGDDSSTESQSNDLRARIEAARSGRANSDSGRSSRSNTPTQPDTRNSDLQQRIEAARKAAEERRNSRDDRDPRSSSSNRTQSPSTIDRGTPLNTGGNRSDDIRARIEAARRAAESRRSDRATPTPADSSSRSRSQNDAASRIEAARRAAEARSSNRSNNSSSAQDRIDAARRAAESRRQGSSSSSSRSSSDRLNDLRSRIQQSTPSRSTRSSTPPSSSRSSSSRSSSSSSRSATPTRSTPSRSATPSRSTPSRSRASSSSSSRSSRSSGSSRSSRSRSRGGDDD